MAVHPTPADALVWGVKSSFRGYVAGIGGSVELAGGVLETPDGFRFPAVASDDPAELRFTGSVRFSAHGGLLDLTIRDPWLRRDADAVELSVAATGEGRTPVAAGPPLAAGSAEIGQLRLLEPACVLFDFSYPPNTPLDSARLLGL